MTIASTTDNFSKATAPGLQQSKTLMDFSSGLIQTSELPLTIETDKENFQTIVREEGRRVKMFESITVIQKHTRNKSATQTHKPRLKVNK